jgi:GWxTD domain-containing protein
MKKYFAAFFLLLFMIFYFGLSALSATPDEKRLTEEINLLITDAEKAEFKKLKKDKDKDLFIQLFWAKRDPNPSTEVNEFKEEYYKRLEHVKKSFIYGNKTGLYTDMGKVYALFGQPASTLRQEEARLILTYPEPSGPREIWIYPSLPWMNLPKKTFNFVFTHDGRGFTIDRNKMDIRVMNVFYSIKKHILLYPDLKELPEFKSAVIFSLRSFENQLIEQVKDTQEDILQIPFEEKLLCIKAQNLSSYLSLLINVDPDRSIQPFPKKITVFGRLERDSTTYDFHQEMPLIEDRDDIISQLGLPVLPGQYTLFLGLSTENEDKYSMKQSQIEVTDFWKNELALSSLIASPQVTERASIPKKEEFNIFSLGRFVLQPLYEQKYSKEDILNVFYYIYNISLDEEKNCSLKFEFELQKAGKTFKLAPQSKKANLGEQRDILEGTRIPLSALPEIGEFELILKVTDEIAQKTVTQKMKFSVTE